MFEFDVILHIDGLQDLSAPQMPLATIMALPLLSGVHLFTHSTGKRALIHYGGRDNIPPALLYQEGLFYYQR
jgi:hypothetical protein